MEEILLFSASVILSRYFLCKRSSPCNHRLKENPIISVTEPESPTVFDVAVIGLGGHGAACISHLACGGMKASAFEFESNI